MTRRIRVYYHDVQSADLIQHTAEVALLECAVRMRVSLCAYSVEVELKKRVEEMTVAFVTDKEIDRFCDTLPNYWRWEPV